MEAVIDFLQPDKYPIDFIIILLVLLSGEFQKRYLCHWNASGATKTLIVSALFTMIYALLVVLSTGYAKELPLRWFFSYVLATSLYELLLRKWFSKLFGNEDSSPSR